MFSGLRSVWVNLKITFLQNFPTFSYLGVILHSTSKNSFLKHETFKPALVKELDRMAELVDYMTHLTMIIIIIVIIIIIIVMIIIMLKIIWHLIYLWEFANIITDHGDDCYDFKDCDLLQWVGVVVVLL